MKTHNLRTWPDFWEAIAGGEKTFEVRKNDREFEVGDTLKLNWYFPEKDEYDGSWIEATVTYILYGPAFGVEEGYCVMAIQVGKVIRAS